MRMVATISMKKVSIHRAGFNKKKANSDPFWVNNGSPRKH